MSTPRILVTGITGKIGGAVAQDLIDRGLHVRGLVRKPDARSDALARLGIEIVHGDLFSAEDLQRAMSGVQRAFYAPPFAVEMERASALFAAAAARANVEAVTVLSQWIASPAHPSHMTRMHWRTDAMFAAEPRFSASFVAPGYFADNYLRFIDFAALLGLFPNLTGASRNAPPSNEDIAAVAAETLAYPERHSGRRYRPTGPALLSGAEIAKIMGEAVGRAVMPIPMPIWLLARAARMQGVPIFDVESLRWYAEDHKQGAFAFGAPTDHVLRVTGRAPEPFDVIARRYALEPRAQRGFGRELRAWAEFMRTPMAPAYDLDGFAKAQGIKRPAHSVYAAKSAHWRDGALATSNGAASPHPYAQRTSAQRVTLQAAE